MTIRALIAGCFYLSGIVGACIVPSVAKANDVIVVCDSGLRDALNPWIKFRTDEGLRIAFCEHGMTADSTAAGIRKLATDATRYIVLVGRTPEIGSVSPNRSSVRIPTFYRPSLATQRFGSTPTYPTDLPYGDFDSDGRPEAVVGRLPIDAPDELSGLVDRILDYENSNDFGPWRQCLQLTAGVGGFGPMVDGAIESITRTALTASLPADAKPQIAYASPGHAFCPVGQSFQDCVMDRYQTGARFWIYAGHGSVDRLDLLRRSDLDDASVSESANQTAPKWTVESLLDLQSVSKLRRESGKSPIGLLLACYTGAIDARGGCLADRMVSAPGGPVALIAATRLTMPYGNARFGLSLLESIYQPASDESSEISQRLGDAVLMTQQSLLSAPDPKASGSMTQTMIDGVAALISPAGNDLTQELREHAGLFQLLGDPTLRLHRAATVDLKAKVRSSEPESGVYHDVEIDIVSPVSGALTISLERPLSAHSGISTANTILPMFVHDPHQCTIERTSMTVDAGQLLSHSIRLPARFTGPIVIQAFVQGDSGWATGAIRKLVY